MPHLGARDLTYLPPSTHLLLPTYLPLEGTITSLGRYIMYIEIMDLTYTMEGTVFDSGGIGSIEYLTYINIASPTYLPFWFLAVPP